MDLLLGAVVLGVLLGCFYAAVSVGLSVSFGLLDVPHVAHPAFLVLASYGVYQLNDSYDIDPLLAGLAITPLFFLFGQNYSPDTLLKLNAATWTLAVEVVFYLVLPFLGILAAVTAARAMTRMGKTVATLVPVGLLFAIGLLTAWTTSSIVRLRRTSATAT